MLKAFGCIERVVKSDFFSLGKDLFYIIRAQHVLCYPLIQVPWDWTQSLFQHKIEDFQFKGLHHDPFIEWSIRISGALVKLNWKRKIGLENYSDKTVCRKSINPSFNCIERGKTSWTERNECLEGVHFYKCATYSG